MSMTKDQANTASTTAETTLEGSIETKFFAEVDAMITMATQMGQFSVIVTTPDGAINQNLVNHYSNLGFKVSLLDMSFENFVTPGDPFWDNFWCFGYPYVNTKKPLRLKISWR